MDDKNEQIKPILFWKKDKVPELIHPVSSFLFLKEEKGLWLHHQIIICHVEKESLEHVTYAQLALADTTKGHLISE